MTFYPAEEMHNLSNPVADPDSHYIGITLAAICTAMAAGLFTSTNSLSGVTSATAERLVADLRQRGYGADVNTIPGSIVVSW
jgi:hypothetical protein